MALPPAVQAQLEAAEAALSSAYPQDPPQQTLEEVAQPKPPAEPVASTPEPPEVTPAPAPAPAPAQDDPNSETWASRYKSLQGLFNHKVPELQQQVQHLSGQLQDAIARLNAAAKEKQEAPPKKPKVDTADVEAFGQELVEMVHRVTGHAAGEVQAALASLAERIDALEGNLRGATETAAATAEEMFFSRLTEKVPEWEAINKDPDFIAWLQEIDPILDAPRGQALTNARQALNAGRVIAIFKTFIATKPSQPPQPQKQTQVEKQVSPKASNASPPPAAPHKPVVTQAQIAKFYEDLRRGEFRGRPDEAKRIELVINEALAEGRVR